MADTTAFQLKADFMPLTVLQLHGTNLESIQAQLNKTIKKAPQYFTYAPVVIDVKKISQLPTLDLAELCNTLRRAKIIPVGIKGMAAEYHPKAIEHGLAIISNEKKSTQTKKTDITTQPTKVISKTVRSGTQVYAKDCDLIVLASVNPGSEVVADGNIHIYGALKGKALAGACGNGRARIFCEALDAELISIAGHYLVKEHIKIPKSKKPMLQINLLNNDINIEGI
jgi:septum site-determining protein MinC